MFKIVTITGLTGLTFTAFGGFVW